MKVEQGVHLKMYGHDETVRFKKQQHLELISGVKTSKVAVYLLS